jgi:lipopolysaccharide biosynthesis protein
MILACKFGLNVPISDQKRVFAPLGSYFWFRSAALAKLFKAGLDYTDFPEEPLPEDGSISHALERIYPFVAQDAGYYTAVVMADQLARMEYTNLRHYVSSYNKSAFEYSVRGLFTMMNATINRRIYDAPKWVNIARERYDHIMKLSDDIEHLQVLYQSTLDYKIRRLVQPLLPRSIFLRLKNKITGGK